MGEKYLNGSAIRQQLLETALGWIAAMLRDAKDVMTELLRDTRAGVERVDLAPPAFAACVWT